MESEAETTHRMRTRSRNATAHPGKVVMDSGRSRRTREEVELEKKQKQARKDEEERKKIRAEAWREAGKAFIAELDGAQAAQSFPRHRNLPQGSVVLSYQMDILLKLFLPDKDRNKEKHRDEPGITTPRGPKRRKRGKPVQVQVTVCFASGFCCPFNFTFFCS